MIKNSYALAVLALAIPAVSTAAEERTVSYSDLNLATPEGQKTLERRITSALQEVCQTNVVRTGTRIRSRDSMRCMTEASKNARAQVAAILERKNLGG